MNLTGVDVRFSPIQGLGMFATRSFAASERIRRVHIVREVTVDAPLRPEAGERVEHCDYPSGKVVLWGFPDRHVNHSCDPNAYPLQLGDGSKEVYIVARRPVREGEEIRFDYNVNTSGGTSWPCNCGATRCRGETIGEFFKLPLAHQIEYLPLLADWFVERHRERIDLLRDRAGGD